MSLRNPLLRRFSPRHNKENGNATIYVLIVVALFAALAFTVARQSDPSEGNRLGDEQADIIASRIISYPYQVQQVIEMMTMSGANLDDLDYTQPGMANFNTPPLTKKIFHPSGGGLVLGRLPPEAIDTSGTPPGPAAGWYLGTFNNVEWTPSDKNDMILAAYPLTRQICENLNHRLTGKTELDSNNVIKIPELSDSIPNVLIDRDNPPGHTVHSGGNIAKFDTDICADCEGQAMLCVKDSNNRYGFYTILISR